MSKENSLPTYLNSPFYSFIVLSESEERRRETSRVKGVPFTDLQ
jgi:hypothetical protein